MKNVNEIIMWLYNIITIKSQINFLKWGFHGDEVIILKKINKQRSNQWGEFIRSIVFKDDFTNNLILQSHNFNPQANRNAHINMFV